MTDRYENIRKALAMGPTPGPWRLYRRDDWHGPIVQRGKQGGFVVQGLSPAAEDADAAHIAACDPDTIRELLAERDALENHVAQMLDALRSAEALAFCCMAEDCYSRREIRDMAEASAPRYTAAIAAENGGGNE